MFSSPATARASVARVQAAICARNQETLRAATDEIGALAVPADVSSEEDVERFVETIIDELGGHDVLVNNAGNGTSAPHPHTLQRLASRRTGLLLEAPPKRPLRQVGGPGLPT